MSTLESETAHALIQSVVSLNDDINDEQVKLEKYEKRNNALLHQIKVLKTGITRAEKFTLSHSMNVSEMLRMLSDLNVANQNLINNNKLLHGRVVQERATLGIIEDIDEATDEELNELQQLVINEESKKDSLLVDLANLRKELRDANARLAEERKRTSASVAELRRAEILRDKQQFEKQYVKSILEQGS
eukprot:Tbor_TRINITY_DN5817_c0_g1::TRINITY_DN5817_c0_g1_i1::g.6638::m.6638